MIHAGKKSILGILIDAIDYEAAVDSVMKAAAEKKGLTVSALAVHGVMTGVLDPEHRYRLNQFGLLLPDGQPVRWALSLLHGIKLRDRVYGPSLMLAVCARAASEDAGIYCYGSTEPILDALKENLLRRFPGLQIAGMQPSRFRRLTLQEKIEVATRIRNSGASIVFVGLGCPRQEVWAYEFSQAISRPILAVGAAFPFLAGKFPQAPKWMQELGLEWFFRFWNEPRRLWSRYLLLNPAYVLLLGLQATRLWRFRPEGREPSAELSYG